MDNPAMADAARVAKLKRREDERFVAERPRSGALRERARASMPRGVPMSWMTQLIDHGPMFAAFGDGAHFTDVDGHRYLDTNISDTSTFCGFNPAPVVRAVSERIARGGQFLLPVEDAIAVAEELGSRFGLPRWQFTLSATSANTEAFRLARHATGRDVILMFEGKYHGHADEMLVTIEGGEVEAEYLGLPENVTRNVRLVQFNDPEALAKALAPGDVACVVTEPALTNCGVIMPLPGFHPEVRRLTREAGTLLVIDETHTQICGRSGLVGRWGLEPDVVTTGKSIGGGVAVGAYGMTGELSELFERAMGEFAGGGRVEELATGGTLFANALSMAASRAALTEVLTEDAYERTTALGRRLAVGIERVAREAGLPWRSHRLYPRSGYTFADVLPRNAVEARSVARPDLTKLIRVYLANRGIWEAIEWAGPAVSVPATEADVDAYLGAFEELIGELTA